MSKLRRVKEIFRQEKEIQDKTTTVDKTFSVVADVTVPPTESIPSPEPVQTPVSDSPVLTPPQSPNDVLRTEEVSYPREIKNQYGKASIQWTPWKMLKPRKILEICTWTMLITTLALEKDSHWQACTPVSIEHAYNLLTVQGKREAEAYVKREKPRFDCRRMDVWPF